ncbi:hypothetical protein [Lactococcus ileimucosae]|uniref:hypothetical protein n=1 Tax=Lactococcus ileimucosae TaxID=2941329 RepID=UPI003519AFCC
MTPAVLKRNQFGLPVSKEREILYCCHDLKALKMPESIQKSSSGTRKITHIPNSEKLKHCRALQPLSQNLSSHLQAVRGKYRNANKNFHRRRAVSFNYGLKIRYNM